jgi:hypothetical protein
MQYGGRHFTPWAAYDGGTDLAYCLGTENAASAYAYGLAYSRNQKKLLGAPTTVTIPARGAKTLRYGSFFAPYRGNSLDGGIKIAEPAGSTITVVGESGESLSFAADSSFAELGRICALAGK